MEAGGIEPNHRPAKRAITLHSRIITILCGTRADVKGLERTPEDKKEHATPHILRYSRRPLGSSQ